MKPCQGYFAGESKAITPKLAIPARALPRAIPLSSIDLHQETGAAPKHRGRNQLGESPGARCCSCFFTPPTGTTADTCHRCYSSIDVQFETG